MLIVLVILAILVKMTPTIWLWLFVPLLVTLDGMRVEFSDYVKAHTMRDKIAQLEIIFGPIVLVVLAIVLAMIKWVL